MQVRPEVVASIEVLYQTEVVGCRGDNHLEGLTLWNLASCERSVAVDTDFLFVFIGAAPAPDWLGDRW